MNSDYSETRKTVLIFCYHCRKGFIMAYDYEYFKREVYTLTKIDLNAYKEKQMKRRIDTLISKHKIVGYDKFVAKLRDDKVVFDDFVNYLTINVSEFYRNPEQWKLLDKDIYPMLKERFKKPLKIWSAACSTGEEPYSLVMSLSKHYPLSDIEIQATDIDLQVMEKAKKGLYMEKSIAAVPEEMKKKYFKQVNLSVQVDDEIKKRVKFRQHNLLRDSYIKDCDMIVCRNVLIYFTDEAKDEIFQKFYDCLKPGGILFIGSTEQIMNYKDIGFLRRGSFFYEKPM